jgi:predicted nucleic acid-binding protein
MRKIIANSTPLIALNKIGKLYLLKQIYREIIIPYAVYEEVILESDTKESNDFIKESGFINIMKIKNEEAKRLFVTTLHKGEVEVMILAKEIEADLCIIDDLLARRYAKYYNLNITGTIGVILKAKEQGIVSKVKPIMDELIDSGIYIDTKLYNRVIEIAYEEY